MVPVVGQKFEGVRVWLDGASFRDCTFVKCQIAMSGLEPFDIVGNEFDSCTFEFKGPAAIAIAFLNELARQGPKGRTIVQELIPPAFAS